MRLSIPGVLTAGGLILAVITSGCGGGESAGSTLTGTVTLDGVPVESGTVQFQPLGEGSTAYALIEDGEYTAFMSRSLSGINPGNYRAAVLAYLVEPGAMDEQGKMFPNGKAAVPRRYLGYDTSGLQVDIAPGEDVVFDIEMSGPVEDLDAEGVGYQ